MATTHATDFATPARGSSHQTHGCSRGKSHGTPEYRTWCYIITRCYNPNAKCYRYYGARGVVMCDRWRHSFENFLADVGARPSDEHSIDRIDNAKGYEPGNCRWATKSQQMRNTSHNRMLTARGRTQCTAAWAAEVGRAAKVIEARLRLGWKHEDAIFTPLYVPMTAEQRRRRRQEYERKRATDPARRAKQREYERRARDKAARGEGL